MGKNPAAVSLGRRGGKKLMEKYGVEHMQKMAKAGAPTRLRRYGGEGFYVLIRYGFQPASMTQEQRERALDEIAAGKLKRSRKRTFAELEKAGERKKKAKS